MLPANPPIGYQQTIDGFSYRYTATGFVIEAITSPSTGGGGASDWSTLTGKPLTFPPDAHTHAWLDITGKPLTFAPDAHTHSWSSITGQPVSFPPSTHTHSAADITFGVLDPARLPPTKLIPVTPAGGTLASLTVAEQALIEPGIWVTIASGETYRYVGGDKTLAASYQAVADITPEWTAVANKPTTFPPTSHGHVWADISGLPSLGIKDVEGVWSRQQTFAPLALTYAATLTWDAATGQKAKVTLTGNASLGAVANVREGGSYLLIVAQDATGGRTLTFTGSGAGAVQVIGAAPTLSTAANAVDLLTFEGVDVAGTIRLRYTGISKGA